MGISKT